MSIKPDWDSKASLGRNAKIAENGIEKSERGRMVEDLPHQTDNRNRVTTGRKISVLYSLQPINSSDKRSASIAKHSTKYCYQDDDDGGIAERPAKDLVFQCRALVFKAHIRPRAKLVLTKA